MAAYPKTESTRIIPPFGPTPSPITGIVHIDENIESDSYSGSALTLPGPSVRENIEFIADNAGSGGGGAVDSVFSRTGVVVAATSDYDANQIDVVPVGNIASTNVQAALAELDSEKATTAHTHTESQISDLNHTDTTAIHDNIAAEITAIAEKTIPASTDVFIIEDSAAANVKKKVQIGNLPGAVDSVFTRTGNVVATTSDYDADQIDVVPVGNIIATDVQAALQELDSEKATSIHTHAAADVTTGTFNDTLIAATNVTQHEAALTITETQISDLDHTDIVAIHDNVAAEISAITEKTTLVDNDIVLIEDSEAANIKKRVSVATLISELPSLAAFVDFIDAKVLDYSIAGGAATTATAIDLTQDTTAVALDIKEGDLVEIFVRAYNSNTSYKSVFFGNSGVVGSSTAHAWLDDITAVTGGSRLQSLSFLWQVGADPAATLYYLWSIAPTNGIIVRVGHRIRFRSDVPVPGSWIDLTSIAAITIDSTTGTTATAIDLTQDSGGNPVDIRTGDIFWGTMFASNFSSVARSASIYTDAATVNRIVGLYGLSTLSADRDSDTVSVGPILIGDPTTSLYWKWSSSKGTEMRLDPTMVFRPGAAAVDVDLTAIHDDTANEISAITEKTTPIAADLLIIEDSAAANIKKKVQIGNLPIVASIVDHSGTKVLNDGKATSDTAIDITNGAVLDIIEGDLVFCHFYGRHESTATNLRAKDASANLLALGVGVGNSVSFAPVTNFLVPILVGASPAASLYYMWDAVPTVGLDVYVLYSIRLG